MRQHVPASKTCTIMKQSWNQTAKLLATGYTLLAQFSPHSIRLLSGYRAAFLGRLAFWCFLLLLP